MNFLKNQHITYCLNVHPGETLDDIINSIKKFTLPVKNKICPTKPFGLGLRLSYVAANELSNSEKLEEFKNFLAADNLYVFTINAFPYGEFHRKEIKENVYLPDWRYNERRDYTIMVADILASLIPKGTFGSISSVPCSYKRWINNESDISEMVIRLMDTVFYLSQLEELIDRHIHIGLEPEPDCFLENSTDVIEFFTNVLYQQGAAYLAYKHKITEDEARELIRRYLGICFDACHFAVQFENLADSINKILSSGISISKIQISSALKCENTPIAREQLQAFCEPVYLHQVKARTPGGEIKSYTDLTAAINDTVPDNNEWRIHFHVPLYFSEYNELQSTSNELTKDFFSAAKNIPHFEIETYTFDVLPPELHSRNIIDSIIDEFEWVIRDNEINKEIS